MVARQRFGVAIGALGIALAAIAVPLANADPSAPAGPVAAPSAPVTVPAPVPVADPAPVADAALSAPAPNAPAPSADPAATPPDGVQHLPSPDSLPPGTTQQAPDHPTTGLLKDIWHALRDGEMSGPDALKLLATRPVDPEKPVMVAGDPERKYAAERQRHGIPVTPNLFAKVRKLAEECGAPWVLD